MVIFASLLLLAGAPAPPPKVAAATPPPVTKPAIRLPKGSEIPLVLAHGVSAKSAQVGDRVILRVAAPVVRMGKLLIPQDTLVEGEVAAITEPGRFGRAGGITIEAKAMIFEEGGRLLLDGILRRDAPERRASASQGVVTVPFGSLSRGKSVNLEAGTFFVATTARDY